MMTINFAYRVVFFPIKIISAHSVSVG